MDQFKYKWWALIGLSLLSFTAFLDFTIVSTALPFIQKHFHTDVSTLQWVTNIFGLVLCMFMIIFGKCGDIFGRRKIFYFAFVLFFIAAFGAGFSQSMSWLIFFRAIQGFAGAGIFTLGVALLPQAFPEEQQATAVGVFSAFNGVGLAIGPFLGGLLITYLSWRWVFFINIPIIVVGIICCLFTLKESQKQPGVKIDLWGFILLVVGLGCLIYGLIHSETAGWMGATWAYVIVGIVALILLLIVESKVKEPLLDLSLFKSSHASLAALSAILAGLITFVLLFFDPLYLHVIRGETAIIIGLVLLAVPIVQVLVSLTLGKLVNKFGVFNLLVLGALTGLISCVMHAYFSTEISIIFILVAFVLMGYTWGIANAGSITAIIQSVPGERIGSSIGTVFTLWNVGGSIFLALGTVIFHAKERAGAISSATSHGLNLTTHDGALLGQALKDPTNAKTILAASPHGQTLLDSVQAGFLNGFHWVGWASAIVMLVGLIVGFALLKASKSN